VVLRSGRESLVKWLLDGWPLFLFVSRRCAILVLSRCVDQSVEITVPACSVPQKIKVMVIEVRGDKARIGFDAHKSIMIHRSEIQRIVDEEGPVIKPERPPVVDVVKIGQPLPGEV
jgi:carbon storage regulator